MPKLHQPQNGCGCILQDWEAAREEGRIHSPTPSKIPASAKVFIVKLKDLVHSEVLYCILCLLFVIQEPYFPEFLNILNLSQGLPEHQLFHDYKGSHVMFHAVNWGDNPALLFFGGGKGSYEDITPSKNHTKTFIVTYQQLFLSLLPPPKKSRIMRDWKCSPQ